jgi:hypothetical protein
MSKYLLLLCLPSVINVLTSTDEHYSYIKKIFKPYMNFNLKYSFKYTYKQQQKNITKSMNLSCWVKSKKKLPPHIYQIFSATVQTNSRLHYYVVSSGRKKAVVTSSCLPLLWGTAVAGGDIYHRPSLLCPLAITSNSDVTMHPLSLDNRAKKWCQLGSRKFY